MQGAIDGTVGGYVLLERVSKTISTYQRAVIIENMEGPGVCKFDCRL